MRKKSLSNALIIALPKGRIYNEILPLFTSIGIHPLEQNPDSRRLYLETSMPNIVLLIVRAVDVPTYVEYGAADLGVTGKDVLMESPCKQFYEPLDLRVGLCRLVAARLPDHFTQGRLRVATKFIRTAKRWYASKGQQVTLIKLSGSMELAPVTGLADLIIDLAATGKTLKANGLVEKELIAPISARLIVNKASMKREQLAITRLLEALQTSIAHRTRKDQEKQG